MKKIEGVQEVKVSLNQSKASVTFKPENHVTMGQILSAVQKNGFNPREAKVRMRGMIEKDAGGLALKVSGNDERYRIVELPSDTTLHSRLLQSTGKTVIVNGTLPPPEKGKAPQTILVQSAE